MDIPEEITELWNRYKLDEKVKKHCIKVAEVALKIAERIKERGHDVDVDSVKKAALLHDIGRSITHDIDHFIHSGKIVRKEGFGEKIARIVERHFLCGITKDDAKRLNLKVYGDFMPETIEEKIVCYADKIVRNCCEISFEEFLKRLDELKNRYPENEWLIEKTKERAIKLKRELKELGGL